MAGRGRHRLGLFVFIDAFGWELLSHTRFLEDLLPVRKPLESVLGYSCACDPTILTGLMPRDHGHFSFFVYAPQRSPFGPFRHLGLLPAVLRERGRVRRTLSRHVQRRLGYSGYFHLYSVPFDLLPLLDYSEKRDLYEPGGINSGAPTIFDLLRKSGLAFHRSDWRAPEAVNVGRLERAIDDGEVTFAYLYLAELDALLHAEGRESARVQAKLEWYGQQLRQLADRASRRYDGLSLHVFSDHGMTAVTQTCNLMAQVKALGLDFGRDYAAVYDSTMARFWFLHERARERIGGLLASVPQGSVLSHSQLERFGCDFADQRYGELLFLAHPGVLICPSFMGRTRLAGMHGYDPTHRDSWSILASNEEPPVPARRIDDLFAVMRTEAGV